MSRYWEGRPSRRTSTRSETERSICRSLHAWRTEFSGLSSAVDSFSGTPDITKLAACWVLQSQNLVLQCWVGQGGVVYRQKKKKNLGGTQYPLVGLTWAGVLSLIAVLVGGEPIFDFRLEGSDPGFQSLIAGSPTWRPCRRVVRWPSPCSRWVVPRLAPRFLSWNPVPVAHWNYWGSILWFSLLKSSKGWRASKSVSSI